MAIFKEQIPPRKEVSAAFPEPTLAKPVDNHSDYSSSSYDSTRRPSERDVKESLIASDITIEGKIDGAGHIRIAGRFKGDVNVQGNLTIENGAKLNGGVRAHSVVIGGELEGNVEEASKIELLESGMVVGDLKAGQLTVAPGSRIRGRVECGWENESLPKALPKSGNGIAS
jgi:cytoskeletal protein CcmA (bactofilin family)